MENLILIHGAIGAADHLEPLANALSGQYHVRVLELDGHGKSSGMNHPFTLDHFANQLSNFIDTIGGEAHVFGYSMGGFLALLQAAKPDPRVRSIFTLGTKLHWDETIATKEMAMLNPDKIEEKVPAFAAALAKRHGAAHWKEVLKNTATLLEEIGQKQPIRADVVRKINCPVHLCLADQDAMVTDEETRRVAGWLPSGSFSFLPNSQHPIEKVDVQVLAKKIREFIEAVK